MSITTKLTWPKVDQEAVCASQDITDSDFLVLDGTLRDLDTPGRISFINAGFIRSVSISSDNDLSDKLFVITGFQNNAPITDSFYGPNNNIVYGSQYFDIITSVSVNGTGLSEGIKVGTGDAGYLPLFTVNTGATTINYSMSAVFPNAVTIDINYSVFQTLEDINTNFISFDEQLGNFFPIAGLINQTTPQIASFQNITNFILVKINSSGTPLIDNFDFVFLQV